MNFTSRKFLQEKVSGLFFTPVTAERSLPTAEKDKAWLYNEQELLATVREHFGGDFGMELVTLSDPTHEEFIRWRSRLGGMAKSPKKTRAVRKNGGKRNRKQPTIETNVTT